MTEIHHLEPVLRDATGDLALRRAAEDDSEYAFAMRKAAFRVYVEKSGGWDERKERNGMSEISRFTITVSSAFRQ